MTEEKIVSKPDSIAMAACWLRDGEFSCGKAAGLAIAIQYIRKISGYLFADGADDEADAVRTVAEQLEGEREDLLQWGAIHGKELSESAFSYLTKMGEAD